MSTLTKRLGLFLDVVQQGSFSKAAALHDMDNSLLSKQIKKLEADLGVQLLNRSTRTFALTSAGKDIFEQTKVLMETLTQIQNIADAHQTEPRGNIRITSSINFGQQYLQPVISQFMKQYPNVNIALLLDDKRVDIISEHFDVAFRLGKLTESNLIARKIAKTHFAIVASEDFIAQHGKPTTPEELVRLPAVVYSNGNVRLDQMSISSPPDFDGYKTYKMQSNFCVSDMRTLIKAVTDGLGYAMIDLFNLDKPLSEAKLALLLTGYGLSTVDTGIYAIYPHRKPTKLVSEFINAVQSYIGTPPFWVDYVPDYKNSYK